MFGIKLRSWMEAHIVRPRKKRSKEAKGKGKTPALPDPPAKSALADPSPANSSSPATCTKRVTLVSPTPSSRVSHGTSPRRPQLPGAARGSSSAGSSSTGRYSTYLSSPESAYSTGYSTDATSPHGYSPGAALPPEYYINLRTGTRYFQSAERQHDAQASTSTTTDEESRRARDERVRFGHQRGPSLGGAPHHHPYCRHTVAKVTRTSLAETGYSYGAPVPTLHKRNEAVDCATRPHVTIRTSFAQIEEVSVCTAKRPTMVQQQSLMGCNSPRQRSRIRTNPWMSSGTTSEKYTTSSSCSDIAPPTPLNEDISTAATIGSWRRDDGQTTTTTADEESAAEEVTAFRRVSRRRDRNMLSPSLARRGSLTSVSTSSSCPSTPRRSSPSNDEEDLTLNEMGRFDESYVYEKETDILSDSDPTDCDEYDQYNGNLTDRHSSNDYLDLSYQNDCFKADFDELDFIDNGPLDCEVPTARTNTGHCTYHQHTFNNININRNLVRPPSLHKRPSRRRSNEKRASSTRRDPEVSPSRKPRGESAKRSASCGGRRQRNQVLAEAEPTSSGQPTPTASNANTPVVARRHALSPENKAPKVPPRKPTCDNSSASNSNTPVSVRKVTELCREHQNGSASNSNTPVSVRRVTELCREHQNGSSSNSNTPVSVRRVTELCREHQTTNRSPASARRRLELTQESVINNNSPVLARRNLFENFVASQSHTPVAARRSAEISQEIASSSTPVSARRYSPDLTNNNTPVRHNAEVSPDMTSSSTPVSVRRKLFENNSVCNTPVRGNKTPDAAASTPVSRKASCEEARATRVFSESEVRLMEADKEADRKYQQLILEAESLLVHMKSASVEEEQVEVDTPIVEEKPFRAEQPSSVGHQTRPDPTSLHLQVTSPNLPSAGEGPVPRKGLQQSVVAIQVTTPSGGPPREIVTFRSVDLSSPVVAEAPYCPQSEPLKRKVYTSAALQRLQEHLALADCAESSDSSPPDDDEQSAQDRLGQKVAALRRERLAAEARLANREEERRKRRERVRAQQQVAVERRNTLLQTLESLKRDLQIQSATLHDAYSSITDLRSPNACDAQRNITSPGAQAPGTPSSDKPRCDFLSPIRRASSLRYPAPPPPPRRC